MSSTTEVRAGARPRTMIWAALLSFVVAVVSFSLPAYLPDEWYETAANAAGPVLLGQMCLGVVLCLAHRTRTLGVGIVLGAATAWVALLLFVLLVMAPALA